MTIETHSVQASLKNRRALPFKIPKTSDSEYPALFNTGEKTCKYQPSIKLPEPFARNVFKKEDVTNLSESSRKYVLSIVENSNYGFFVPYEPNKNTIQYGENGGAQWTGASVDPYKNIMYVLSLIHI